MLVPNGIDQLAGLLNVFDLVTADLHVALRDVHVVLEIDRIIFMQPADSCGLNPSAGFRLHFFRILKLHELVAFKLVEATDTNEVLSA